MRIGNGQDIKWNNTGESIAGRKQTAREGGGQSVPGDTALAALDAYEAHQRLAFETVYWNEPEEVLSAIVRDRLDDLANRPEFPPPDAPSALMRGRRIAAEVWAINRVLQRRLAEREDGERDAG